MSVHELEAVSLRLQRVPTRQRSGIVAAWLRQIALANPAGGLDNRGRQIQTLGDLTLHASGGAARADHDARIVSAGSVDNSAGLISAGHELAIIDAGTLQAIINTGGTLIGGQAAVILAASLTGDGRLLSLDGLTLELSGGYHHTASGEVTANGDASITFDSKSQSAAATMHRSANLNTREVNTLSLSLRIAFGLP